MRVGERGEGKWKEISWEEAYKTIASRVMDIIKNMTTDQPSHLLLQKVFRKLSLNISQEWWVPSMW